MSSLKIANSYGNVDVGKGLPRGYIHVPGQRLTTLCRKHNIDYAAALVDWNKSGRYWKPVLDGVVVKASNKAKLLTLIEERKARAQTPAQRKAAKQARQRRDEARFIVQIKQQFPKIPDADARQIAAHACEIGSGRVGRSRRADDPVYLAVQAHARHRYTDYDDYFEDSYDHESAEDAKADAREAVWREVWRILAEWGRAAQQPDGHRQRAVPEDSGPREDHHD
jgi:hypothetical protein